MNETTKTPYEIYHEKSEAAKSRAKTLLDEWEKDGLSVEEVEMTIRHLKDEMTEAYHNWQRNTPFHRVNN